MEYNHGDLELNYVHFVFYFLFLVFLGTGIFENWVPNGSIDGKKKTL